MLVGPPPKGGGVPDQHDRLTGKAALFDPFYECNFPFAPSDFTALYRDTALLRPPLVGGSLLLLYYSYVIGCLQPSTLQDAWDKRRTFKPGGVSYVRETCTTWKEIYEKRHVHEKHVISRLVPGTQDLLRVMIAQKDVLCGNGCLLLSSPLLPSSTHHRLHLVLGLTLLRTARQLVL